MARIRTIKPEFWDSPSVAKASPWARLLFIAMWNWADDFGRGTANLKELEGFAFPHDDEFTDSSGNTVHFRSLVAEVSACFGVVFYEHENRPYYAIPTWDTHQRNERRSKDSKYPAPPVITGQNEGVAEIPRIYTEMHGVSVAGTGEQGNRGTGEQGNSDSLSPDESDDTGTLIPPDWRPNQTHIDKAASLHLDVQNEYQRFRASAEAKHRRLKNWNAGFTNWLRKTAEYRTQRQGTPTQSRAQQRQANNLNVVAQLAALDQTHQKGIGQ